MAFLRFWWDATVSGGKWFWKMGNAVATVFGILAIVGIVVVVSLGELPLWAVVLIFAVVVIVPFMRGAYDLWKTSEAERQALVVERDRLQKEHRQSGPALVQMSPGAIIEHGEMTGNRMEVVNRVMHVHPLTAHIRRLVDLLIPWYTYATKDDDSFIATYRKNHKPEIIQFYNRARSFGIEDKLLEEQLLKDTPEAVDSVIERICAMQAALWSGAYEQDQE
ncbi:hypothetical protein BH20ACT23_BH20ACT23_11550 [soil metagenome]